MMAIKIPITSPENYITGITALNIISEEGTGDWHSIETFYESFGREPAPLLIAGIHTASSTQWLGEGDLFDSTTYFKERGVQSSANQPIWTANHYRAITDMVINLTKHEASLHLARYLQFDEWFGLLTEKQRAYNLLKKINNKGGFNEVDWKNIEMWIENEIYLNHFYVVNRVDNLSANDVKKGKEYFESNFVIDTNTWSFKNKL